jgi:hypothetical protein
MRNVFLANNRSASLGRYAFGFAWGSWAALLLSTILFFMSRHKRRDTTTDGVVPAERRRRGWKFWGRRRGTGGVGGSRRSYNGRHVKEEYV